MAHECILDLRPLEKATGVTADGLGVATVTALGVAALRGRVAALGGGLRPLLLLRQAAALLAEAPGMGRE